MGNIAIGNKGNGSAGDCSWITAAFRYFDGKVILHDNEQCRKMGKIFDNICEVEYSENPPERPDKKFEKLNGYHLDCHTSRKILLGLGINNPISVPLLKVTKEETEWAKDFLKEYNNPVAIVNDNAGSNDPNNVSANYRRTPVKILQNIVDSQKDITFLQFGISNKFTPLNNCIHLVDLSIRQLISCYSVIRQYIGNETGDYHLMLGVGGQCLTFIPKENHVMGYNYSDLLYRPENFENGISRVKYQVFN